MKTRPWLVILLFFTLWPQAGWGEVVYSSKDLRDPFFEAEDSGPTALTPSSSLVPEQPWALGGVLWAPSANMRQVEINGQRVREGDSVNGALVVSIDKKEVKLKRDGKEGSLTKQGIQWT